MKRFKTTLVFAIISGLCTMNTACSPSNELQTKYGKNSSYFIALQNQESGNDSDAERFFRTTAKKANPLFARLASEELCNYGTRPQQIQKLLDYNKKYHDEQSLEFACKKLFEKKEYSEIIKITSNIDFATASDNIIYYRCTSLYRKANSNFSKEFILWSTTRTWTQNLYRLYCESDIQDPLSALRSYIYTRDYTKAYTAAAFLLENLDTYKFTQLPLVCSDIGKAYFYGSRTYEKNAMQFDSIAEKFSPECQFYIYFYSARMFTKAGASYSKAIERFQKSMDLANTDALYDNALWYYLDTSLTNSINDGVTALKKYASTWKEPDYYDDFLETLSLRICSTRLWEDFYIVADAIQGYASKEMCAKYNYLTARLLQEGFLNPSKIEGLTDIDNAIHERFTKALDSGTNVYYRLLSATALDIPDEAILEIFYNNVLEANLSNPFVPDTQAETLFKGLIDFGLGNKIYDLWQRFGNECGTETVTIVSKYLKNNATEDSQDFAKSLRIASKKVSLQNEKISRELLELMYPRNYQDYVNEACTRFNEKEYIMYGLIRSESFFDPCVTSTASALGLTQLMDATANDIARKLKVADYDLCNPNTNITFGTFYLSDLTRLFDGTNLLAIFSYNGGRSRVRSWVKSANMEFGTSKLPLDLFLEVIPFEETREYGRKVVSAAAMYGLLYYDITGTQIVNKLIFEK